MGDVVRWPKSRHLEAVGFCSGCGTLASPQVRVCPMCRAQIFLTTAGPPEESRFRRRSVVDLGEAVTRIPTGFPALDTVLGGGFAAGSVVLVVGPPGIGKSTLLLQAAGTLAGDGRTVVVASAEEGETQFKDRCGRVFVQPPATVFFLESFDLDEILHEAADAALLVVDSLQTVMLPDVDADAGSRRQLLACTDTLVAWARRTGTPVALLGHVTKAQDVAGPSAVAHRVDVVCYLEAGPEGSDPGARVLAVEGKNRYGVSPCAVALRMGAAGLEPAGCPSATSDTPARP